MVKRIISILFLCSVALCSRTTIAIFDFENNGLEPHEVRQLTKRLESELVKLEDYNVVERSKIDEVLKEQKIQASGCTETCLIDVGKILGATQIVYGSVGRMGTLYTISAKLVDAETGQLLVTSDYDADEGLIELLKLGLKTVAFQLQTDYKPSYLTIHNIYVFRGRVYNQKHPHKLYVMEDGKEIYEVDIKNNDTNIKKDFELKLRSRYEIVLKTYQFIKRGSLKDNFVIPSKEADPYGAWKNNSRNYKQIYEYVPIAEWASTWTGQLNEEWLLNPEDKKLRFNAVKSHTNFKSYLGVSTEQK